MYADHVPLSSSLAPPCSRGLLNLAQIPRSTADKWLKDWPASLNWTSVSLYIETFLGTAEIRKQIFKQEYSLFNSCFYS